MEGFSNCGRHVTCQSLCSSLVSPSCGSPRLSLLRKAHTCPGFLPVPAWKVRHRTHSQTRARIQIINVESFGAQNKPRDEKPVSLARRETNPGLLAALRELMASPKRRLLAILYGDQLESQPHPQAPLDELTATCSGTLEVQGRKCSVSCQAGAHVHACIASC